MKTIKSFLAIFISVSVLFLAGCATNSSQSPCYKKPCPIVEHQKAVRHVVQYAK